MIDSILSTYPAANGTLALALAVALDVGMKMTLILILAFATHAALSRRRALVRSALWNATLVGLMILPLASVAFPRLRIPAPVTWKAAPIEATRPIRNDLSRDLAPVVEALPGTSAPISPKPVGLLEKPAVIEATSTGPAPELASPPRTRSRLEAAQVLIGIYLAVAVFLAIRFGVSLAALRKLIRLCNPVHDPAWVNALDNARDRLGIARHIALLASNRVSIPLVIGWRRPAIIVPEALARTASPVLIETVLLHELAHVRRGDFGWNLVCKLVRLLYWPHPLVWPLGRIVSSVREQACDDLCVHGLGGAAVYRASLLEVASRLVQRPELGMGVALARATNLGRRLAWIDLSQGASRCVLSAPARLAVVVTVVAVAAVLGSLELDASAAKANQKPTEQQPASVPQTKPADGPKASSHETQPDAIEVVVLAKDTGKQLPGASVRPSIDFEQSIRKTDRDGRIRIDLTGRKFQDTLSLDLWAEGYVQQRYFFAQNDARYPKIPARFTVELLPGEETLGGKVVDEQKRPISGAEVKIWGYIDKKEKHELAYMVDARTDENGQWRCRCFRAMKFAYLYLSHSDYLRDDNSHPRRHGQPSPQNQPVPDGQPLAGLRDFSDVQVMTAGVSLAGMVTDEDDKPIAGAEVGWLGKDFQGTFHDAMPVTSTNAAGRFRFPHVLPEALLVLVKAKGYAPELKPLDAIDMAGHLTIKLIPPRSLSGRVVDSGEKPIPDAFVTVDTWRGSRALGVYLKSDAVGRFRWDDAPPDAFLINVSRTGYTGILQRPVRPDENDVTFILKRSLSFSGRIRDVATDKPIDPAIVEVGVPDPKTGEIAWAREMQLFSFQGTLQGNIDVEKRPELRLRISADGYEPLVSRVFRRDENQVDFDAKLTRADKPQGVAVSGAVRRPDGQPLAGATVAITYPMAGKQRLHAVQIEDGKMKPNQPMTTTKTDVQGRFTLGREPDPEGQYFAVVIVHPDFYAEVDRSVIESRAPINAKPWGRVEGTVYVRGNPAAGASIRYSGDRIGNSDVPYIFDSGQAKADDRGRFVIERVVPGDVRLARDFSEGSRLQAWSNGDLIVVRPGETVRAQVGGKGRPVVAKIVPPVGFDSKANYAVHSEFAIESDRPMVPYPKEMLAKHDRSLITFGKQWFASEEGHEYRRKFYRYGQAKLQKDGTILVDDVPPGDYRLTLTYSAYPINALGRSPDRVAYATKQFTIPEIPGGRSDEPFDLGVLRPKLKETLKVGQPAPAFDVETLDGRRVKLEEFRGKFVLLDFWATWCGPCIAEIPALKEIHDRFGKDERFAMLSLSLDAGKEAPRNFVAEKQIPWTQGFLGEWVEGGVPAQYHVEAIPALFLIGPDGTIVSKDLRGEAIAAAVVGALTKP